MNTDPLGEPLESKVPLTIEGAALPSSVYWLNLAAYHTDDFRDDVYEWLHDLRYANVTPRSLDSSRLIEFAQYVREWITSGREILLVRLKELDSSKPWELFLDEWNVAMLIILDLAQSRDCCSWVREGVGVDSIQSERLKNWIRRMQQQSETSGGNTEGAV